MADNNIDYLYDAKVADNKYEIDYKCKYCNDTKILKTGVVKRIIRLRI